MRIIQYVTDVICIMKLIIRKLLKDLEEGSIVKVENNTNPCINCNDGNVILTIGNQYICLTCRCVIGYKSDDSVKVEYYRKRPYNRKYHLEKSIKNMVIMKTSID